MSETPLVNGDRIAWTLVSYGKTDGLSSIHRVYGMENDDTGVTYCGQDIPQEIRRLEHVLQSLPLCGKCEAMLAESRGELKASA